MGLKKGDIIDEYKRFPDSCGLIVKIMAGGDGFQKVVCCGHELTDEDVVPEPIKKGGRKPGPKGRGIIIDEKKSYPESCGLRLMIIDGGHGFQLTECCGHPLTMANEKALSDLGTRSVRRAATEPDESAGPTGTA